MSDPTLLALMIPSLGTLNKPQWRLLLGNLTAYFMIQFPGRTAWASFSSRVLQHLQPPQLRQSHQQPNNRCIRAPNANAGEQSGLRWREWRLQPALSDQRPPLHPALPQAPILEKNRAPACARAVEQTSKFRKRKERPANNSNGDRPVRERLRATARKLPRRQCRMTFAPSR